jgi:hypothetical protein
VGTTTSPANSPSPTKLLPSHAIFCLILTSPILLLASLLFSGLTVVLSSLPLQSQSSTLPPLSLLFYPALSLHPLTCGFSPSHHSL